MFELAYHPFVLSCHQMMATNTPSISPNRRIAYKIVPRRAGDIAECFANPKLAKSELNWEAKFGINKMCEDAWRWQSKNPNGYK